MIVARPAASRGHADHGWLDSHHTFSFASYHDPQWMGFGPLRVINEDRIAPGGGFAPHRHANMEIISVVLQGALAHRDSIGSEGVLRPGEVQWMSAGHGIEHSEYNGDPGQATHFLQIWIQPDRLNAEPDYAQRRFDPADRRGRWQVLAASDKAPVDGALAIRQDARLSAARLGPGQSLAWRAQAARGYWLHVATGAVELEGHPLAAGDALGLLDEDREFVLTGRGDDEAEVLLFELPR